MGNNITCAINCNYREAAIVNTHVNVIGNNNSIWNIKIEVVPGIAGVTGTISKSFRK
jgi:hypothetical protein